MNDLAGPAKPVACEGESPQPRDNHVMLIDMVNDMQAKVARQRYPTMLYSEDITYPPALTRTSHST